MVTTGYPRNSGTRTEVIDVENSNVICKDLEDFPMELYAASGANLTSMPIVCGGLASHPSDKCFKVSTCLYRTIVTIKGYGADVLRLLDGRSEPIFQTLPRGAQRYRDSPVSAVYKPH